MLRKPNTQERRSAGFTLLELTVATGVMALTMGTVALVFNALTSGTAELQRTLLARNESERARIDLTNDLQLTDTLGVDGLGNPFFEVLSEGGGTNNVISFRNVEGFESDGVGGVQMVYSNPVRYELDGSFNLIRTQDSDVRVVAIHVRGVSFQVTASGAVVIELITYAYRDHEEKDVTSRFQIAPRNILQM